MLLTRRARATAFGAVGTALHAVGDSDQPKAGDAGGLTPAAFERPRGSASLCRLSAPIIPAVQEPTQDTIEIRINGQSRTLAAGRTVAELLRELDLHPVRVAVEINENLVPRRSFDRTPVAAGDRIEIVTFVGGG
ncbi:MAG: sulfur carrier protein ThiS [Phycisphaerales bacterium]|nr:MAG: sulfur carrier protein ThiS [Phycisphaerales bacterium]